MKKVRIVMEAEVGDIPAYDGSTDNVYTLLNFRLRGGCHKEIMRRMVDAKGNEDDRLHAAFLESAERDLELVQRLFKKLDIQFIETDEK